MQFHHFINLFSSDQLLSSQYSAENHSPAGALCFTVILKLHADTQQALCTASPCGLFYTQHTHHKTLLWFCLFLSLLHGPFNSFKTITGKFSALMGNLLYIFGSCVHHSAYKRDVYPFRPTSKGDALRICLYKLVN